MSTPWNNTTFKGKRYSAQERAKILAFVDQVNAESGRGGIRRTTEKFGVTALTVSRWMREREMAGPGEISESLRKMTMLLERITEVEEELEELRRQYVKSKKRI